MKRIALIDTDGLCWAAAARAEKKVGNDVDGVMYLEGRTLKASYEELLGDIEGIIAGCGAEDAILCLTHGENFRLSILPTYKGNRKEMHRPAQLTGLRDMLQEEKPYPVLIIKGLEADDVLGISAGSLLAAGNREPVICSEDKDLRTIPGLLFTKRGGLETITEEAAELFHLGQTLTGDQVDGYKGCPGIGPAQTALLWRVPREDRWDYVVSCYEAKGLTEEDALTQARVARILRSEDWNADTAEPILWTPPSNRGGTIQPTSPGAQCGGDASEDTEVVSA